MSSPTRQNILKNTIFSVFLKLIRVADQLLLVPFYISAWGVEYYGDWITLMVIPTVMGLSDLGFGTAASNSFVQNYAQGKIKEAKSIYKNGILVTHVFVIFSIVCTVVLIYVANTLGFFDNISIDRDDAIAVLILMLISKIINFYKQLFDAFFISGRVYHKSINIFSAYSVIIIIATMIVLKFGGDVVVLSASNLIISVVFIIIHYSYAKKEIDADILEKGKYYDKELIKSLLSRGVGYLLNPIWQAVFFQGTTLAVRVLLGPAAAVVFNTARSLVRSSHQITQLLTNSISSEMKLKIARGELGSARVIYRISLLVIVFISLSGMFFLKFFGNHFYSFWTNKELSMPARMWDIFIMGVLFNSVWNLNYEVIIAKNKPYVVTVAALSFALISVLITYIFSLYFGLDGAAFGVLSMEVLLFLYSTPVALKIISQSFGLIGSDLLIDLKKNINIK